MILAGEGSSTGYNTAKTGQVSEEATIAAQGTGSTSVTAVNNGMLKGEKDFGAKGLDVTVSIANGANGFQVAAQNTAIAGATTPGLAGTPAGGAMVAAGKVGEAMAPKGTIDGSATLRITGNGNVTYVGGETRPFPSYAVYSYTMGADGKITTTEQRRRSETPPVENLTKPKTPW